MLHWWAQVASSPTERKPKPLAHFPSLPIARAVPMACQHRCAARLRQVFGLLSAAFERCVVRGSCSC
eukprot:13086435-Alexandrium_andersonii.AAC.1